MAGAGVELQVGDRTVRISSPDRVYFPARGETKLDLAHYYLSVGDGIVRALRERPCMMHRFPAGVAGEKVHQKRVPNGAPPWLETVRGEFPRYGRHAYELCVTGWPKTSGGNGLHVYVRIAPRWGFAEVRRAAYAFAREVERRVPGDVTTTWWRKDRDPTMLFVDYNQNARDHTMASAYSVRGVPEATVSTPITWDEIDDVDPREFTIATVPGRFAQLGDLHQGIDDSVYSLDTLLEWADRDGLDWGAAVCKRPPLRWPRRPR